MEGRVMGGCGMDRWVGEEVNGGWAGAPPPPTRTETLCNECETVSKTLMGPKKTTT